MTDDGPPGTASTPRDPSHDPAVYWFWSRIPGRAEAERQVSEIAEAGISRLMIQARLSFPLKEYLSGEYLRGYRGAVEAAGAAGLQVGIYDEYNWMSGHGGGRTVDGAGHLRERHLFWSSSERHQTPARATVSEIRSDWFDGLGRAAQEWIYEHGVRRFDEWDLVAAVAHPPGESDPAASVEVTGWARCTGRDDGCEMELSARAPVPDGWLVTFFASARCASSRAINYLDPGAAERFLEVAYEPYLRALDGLIGDPVTSFSFDHPYGGFYDWREREGEVTSSMMWHPAARLADGDPELSPAQLLLAVVRDLGPRAIAPRCRFFSAYSARGIESFFGTLAEWARAHGVGLTGHELLAHVGGWDLYGAFPELDLRTNFGGDHFAIDGARTETFVDASNFSAQLSPIIGDSVARAHGRGRCTVEQYAARREPPEDFAAGYWELTLPELRLQALRLHVLGVRQFLFHAFGQSDGTGDNDERLANPRFDFPPTCNFEPWFGHFPAFARESAAVSRFIDGAEPIRDVALVYPLHTLWSCGQAHPHGRLFGRWAELLGRGGVGFDVVDDRALDRADMTAGRVRLAGGDYRAVVLAGVSVLPSTRTADVLESLAAGGGTILATAPLPAATAGEGAVPGLAERVASVCAEPVGDAVPAQVPVAILERCSGPVINPGDGPGTLWRWSGRAGETTRVVLLNDGSESRQVQIAAPGDGRAGVHLELEPEEVVCVQLYPEARRLDLPESVSAPQSGDAAVPLRTLRHGWTLTVPGADTAAIDPDRGWEQQGFETFAGVGTYRCRFERPSGGVDGDRWTLTLPVVNCAVRAVLNGATLGARGWRPYRFEVESGLLRGHDNELVLEVANSAANRYYARTRFQSGLQPSGLGAAPALRRAAPADPTMAVDPAMPAVATDARAAAR